MKAKIVKQCNSCRSIITVEDISEVKKSIDEEHKKTQVYVDCIVCGDRVNVFTRAMRDSEKGNIRKVDRPSSKS